MEGNRQLQEGELSSPPQTDTNEPLKVFISLPCLQRPPTVTNGELNVQFLHGWSYKGFLCP